MGKGIRDIEHPCLYYRSDIPPKLFVFGLVSELKLTSGGHIPLIPQLCSMIFDVPLC